MSLYRFAPVILIISGLIYYLFFNTIQLDEVILKTYYGSLKGFKSLSRQGKIINTFQAIPYAKPPIGELRFQPPVENGKWEFILDATIPIPICLQADTLWKTISGQEDCLYLNIFTSNIPINTKNEKLFPVMVFIHGGHFMFGGSDIFGPKYLLDEDVVLVTLNYRLGALGFLNIGDHARGNMGLKDQVMALKWIKSTIKDFGGDPNLITIFGNSAGGASVHFHMISSLSQGLFQRAISQSGTVLCPWSDVLQKDTKSQAQRLGVKLKCQQQNLQELFNCINSTDGNQIVETQMECFDMFHSPEAIYGPSIETDENEAFLTKTIYKSYKEGKLISKIPWIAGVNSEDGCYKTGAFGTDEKQLQDIYNNWNFLAPNALVYKNKNPKISKEILKYYFGKTLKTFTTNDYQILTNMFSDRYFFGCTSEAGKIHSKYTNMYLYYFNYKSDFSLGEALAAANGKYPIVLEIIFSMAKKILNWETHDFGVCHADELRYFFNTIPFLDILTTSPHYKFSKSLVQLWVTFAKNGHPGIYDNVEWIKVGTEDEPYRYLNLDLPSNGMINEPFTSRVLFLKNLNLQN